MAQEYSRLCTLLIEDVYGELCAQVFTTLSSWGRLNLPTLIRHCQLSPKHVRHGLAVLIQYHLVFHFTHDSDGQTFYDVDWDGAYNIMRAGKVIQIVEDRFGSQAAQVASDLLQFGHARVGDLEDAYKFDPKSSHSASDHTNGDDLTNGYHKPQNKKIATRTQLHSVLYQLLKAGFITRVHLRTYHTAADTNNEADDFVKNSSEFAGVKTTGPKASLAFAEAVRTLKRKWRDEIDDTTSGVMRHAPTNGHGPAAKRRRTDAGMVNGYGSYTDEEDVSFYLERDMVIKVNYEKCKVAMRSEALERLAARSIGDVTAKVYGALLKLLEGQVHRCFDDLETYDDEEDEDKAQPSATTLDIGDMLSPSLDLTTTIADDDDDQLNGDHYNDTGQDIKPSLAPPSSINTNNNIQDRNKRFTQIEQHMSLLAEHPRAFCHKISTRGRGEWRINFPSLSRFLQRNEIESTISARFGSVATRIARMLHANGKLDEKQVANLTLMRQKDIRSIMAEMHESGFLEAQEVPKDNSRQPAKTLFLWYFDPERCRRLIVSMAYKAQARLIMRMRAEKADVMPVVQKAERLDVVGHEDEFLTQGDKATLRRWREFEEKLLCQLARQDELMAVMRDFLGELVEP